MKLELVILNSVIEVFRNSVDINDPSLLFKFDKIGFWSCGKWGSEPGYLIDGGIFEEDKTIVIRDDDTAGFEDAMNGEEAIDDLVNKSHFPSGDKIRDESFDDKSDVFNLKIFNLKAVTGKNKDKHLFLSLGQNESLALKIIFEDPSYDRKNSSTDPFPLKSIKTNTNSH